MSEPRPPPSPSSSHAAEGGATPTAGAAREGSPAAPAGRRPPARADVRARRRRRGRAAAILLLLAAAAELLLSLPAPASQLDRVRHRTFAVDARDADAITLQAFNVDPHGRGALMRYDPRTFWRMAPEAELHAFFTDVRTDARGLRGRDVPARKAPGELRLLFLGDSVTFGFRVAEHERWSDRVAAALAERRTSPVTVLNAGVPGYSSFQGVRVLQELLPLRPDVVFAAFGVNDTLRRPVSDAAFAEVAGSRWWRLRHALRRSRLVCAAELLLAWVEREADVWGGAERRALVRWIGHPRAASAAAPVPRCAPDEVLANLERARELCRQAGAAFVVVTEAVSPEVPSARLPEPQYFEDLTALFAQLDGWARARGVPLADAAAAFAASDEPPAALLSDFCHPTAAGHDLLARTVLETLQRSGLAGP